jgi:hypothetical protein
MEAALAAAPADAAAAEAAEGATACVEPSAEITVEARLEVAPVLETEPAVRISSLKLCAILSIRALQVAASGCRCNHSSRRPTHPWATSQAARRYRDAGGDEGSGGAINEAAAEAADAADVDAAVGVAGAATVGTCAGADAGVPLY